MKEDNMEVMTDGVVAVMGCSIFNNPQSPHLSLNEDIILKTGFLEAKKLLSLLQNRYSVPTIFLKLWLTWCQPFFHQPNALPLFIIRCS